MKKLDIQIYDGQITPHFNIREFRCPDNGEILLNADVIDHIRRLEKLRVWYKRCMTINSGYRTPAHNKAVGGAENSRHLLGIASDVALPDEFYTYNKERKEEFLQNIRKKWTELCNEDGLGGGIGFYDTFFHLDSRRDASFWEERK